MSGYCALGDHAHCYDTAEDTGACSCPCHLKQAGVKRRLTIAELALIVLCAVAGAVLLKMADPEPALPKCPKVSHYLPNERCQP